MKHWHYMAVCGVLVIAAIGLIAVGAGALAFLPVLGCALMMGMMVWMMVVGSRGRP